MNENVMVEIDTEGESGKKYQGSFEVRLHLTLKEKGEASREFAKRSLGILSDDEIYYVFKAISLLNKHIVDAPEWWDGGYDLIDATPVYELSKKIRETQEHYAKAGKEEDSEEPKG